MVWAAIHLVGLTDASIRVVTIFERKALVRVTVFGAKVSGLEVANCMEHQLIFPVDEREDLKRKTKKAVQERLNSFKDNSIDFELRGTVLTH